MYIMVRNLLLVITNTTLLPKQIQTATLRLRAVSATMTQKSPYKFTSVHSSAGWK